jgi:TolB-like protein
MKARILTLMSMFAATVVFAELPKVAVLDAVLPDGVDPNVSVGVTEKISEALVTSGKFLVLDRSTVGESLKEIEFQMSGLVNDADIKKAGEQLNSRLGASYVVTIRVSRMAETYFISAKMIYIKTGEITAQSSDQAKGGDEVTLQLAQAVGGKLAASAKEAVEIVAQKTSKRGGWAFEVKAGGMAGFGGYTFTGAFSALGALAAGGANFQFDDLFSLGGWLGLTVGYPMNVFPVGGLKLVFGNKVDGFAFALDLGLMPGIGLYYRGFFLDLGFLPWIPMLVFSLEGGYSFYVGK